MLLGNAAQVVSADRLASIERMVPAIASTYSLIVEGAWPLSSSSCKKVSMWDMSHDIGSKFRAELKEDRPY